jgi:pyridoxamine 5'-phosphate oxidase
MKYKHLREEYQTFELNEGDLPESPFQLFEKWFDEAIDMEPKDANAMVLSTLSETGWPQGRVVLLKEVDHGFVWFTNYASHKGKDLEAHPKASLTFWWPGPARQVRVHGEVEKVSEKESEEYFQSRPRGSQAGAIASVQSAELHGRTELEKKYRDLVSLPESEPLNRPEHWGGYRLLPVYFEFWQGRESRLHDRLFYRLENGQNWITGRLSP